MGTLSKFAVLLIIGIVIVIGAVIAIAASSKKETSASSEKESYFDGNTFQLIGYRILSALVCGITLGIAYPWMLCTVQRWETKHTVINGRRLKFTGHGHQLIGKYLLWLFLTLITFGIYGIWLGLGMKKWVVKHTVYADDKKPVDSYFSGGAGGYLGIHILAVFLTAFTFGIGAAWANKMIRKWEAKHTHIGGSPLEFHGTGGQLLVKYLLLLILTPLTLGIYALFFTVSYMKWQVKHTGAVYQSPEIQAKARAHETASVQDYARYRIAANDQEIAAMKSGYTGKEDTETLEQMAADGNPFAAYHLAKQLKGDGAVYEDRALELLQIAAAGKYHPALLNLGKQLPAEQALSVLTEAAGCGSGEASWLLSRAYQNAGDLSHSAYWFKVALEWGVAEAKSQEQTYDDLIQSIALQLSESQNTPKQNTVLAIVLGIAGAVVALVVVLGIMAIFGLRPARQDNTPERAIIYLDTVDIDEIQGESYSGDDHNGNDLEYIIDENAFLDKEDHILYLNFGLVEYEKEIYLWIDNEHTTQVIPEGNGITEIRYPYSNPPSFVGVWANYDEGCSCLIKKHDLDVTTGDSDDAQQWLEERYSSNDLIEDPVIEDTDPNEPTEDPVTDNSEMIVGQWERTDIVTSIFTGEDILYIKSWNFRSDGTFEFIDNECISTESVTNDHYYGQYWLRAGGTGYEGNYSLDGTRLAVSYYDPLTESQVNQLYSVNMDGNSLWLEDDMWNQEYQKVTKQDHSDVSIIGNWCKYSVQDNGSMDLKRWVFRNDGSCDIILEYCFPSDNPNDISYNGTYWRVGSGNAYPGTYTLNGTELAVTTDVSEPGDPPQMSTSVYTVEINGDTLSLYSHWSDNTEEFTKAE